MRCLQALIWKVCSCSCLFVCCVSLACLFCSSCLFVVYCGVVCLIVFVVLCAGFLKGKEKEYSSLLATAQKANMWSALFGSPSVPERKTPHQRTISSPTAASSRGGVNLDVPQSRVSGGSTG